MKQTGGREVVIVRGQGTTVWDRDGNAYLDGTASLWYCNVGHGRREIADAITAQLGRIESFQTFDVYANEPALELAEKVASLAPMAGSRVFLTPGGGSDAVDSACKMVRRYWSAVGRPEKRTILARRNAYHGMNAYGTSLSGIAPNREGFGELIPDVELVEWDSVDGLRAVLERSADTIGAFIGEPVIGAGGLYPPPDGYWPGVADLCREHDVLLISDEVICGFGRLGRWFGCERYGVEPDLVVCAKGLTSGYLPLGAVIASARVAFPFWEAADADIFRHGYTYAGHPVACVAALANIGIIEREGLVARVAEIEPTFRSIVEEGFSDSEVIGEIRGAGLLAAVPVRDEYLAANPMLPQRIATCARDQGLIVRALSGAIQLSPPLTATLEELSEIVRRLRAALEVAVDGAREPATAAPPAV